MTDLSLPSSTHPGPFVDSLSHATNALASSQKQPPPLLANGGAAVVVDEEEDYTIKCVCDFQDDDGNTVLCETCDTWQHIECYYPGTKGPGEQESHYCVDCQPRYIDKKRANERQRARRSDVALADRKPKKQPAAGAGKSHKKKATATKNGEHDGSGSNGWSNSNDYSSSSRNGTSGSHTSGSPREQPLAVKRPRSNHKPSNSLHTQTVPLKLPAPSSSSTSSSARRSTSASHTLQSPTKSSSNGHIVQSVPDFDPYSYEFMHMYDDDAGDSPMKANLFNDIAVTQALSLWSHDPDEVREATKGKSHQDIYFRVEQSLESMNMPSVRKETRTDESVERYGRHPQWTYLTVESAAPKNAIVGELRGKVGFMKDYVKDEANKWEYLRHPLPFVFFHPALPIYIDARREGTTCRYVRRSCKPNTHLTTMLENGSDYRFCFTTSQDLEPGTEVTIPWTPDEHVRSFTRHLESGHKFEALQDSDVDRYVQEYFAKVLAWFGGCACNNPDSCPLTTWARRGRQNLADHKMLSNGKAKKSRKGAGGTHRSSHNAAKHTGSRSGSEALRYQDDDDADDGRSTSTSSRSKPQSRDLTPSYQGANEKSTTGLGLELSDREKRKIAALEKNFELLENDRSQPAAKKKKRTSGGPTPAPPASSTSHTGAGSSSIPAPPASASRANFLETKYEKILDAKADAHNHHHGFSSMPSTPASAPRPRYVDAGTVKRGSQSPVMNSPHAFPQPKGGISNPHSPTISSPLSRPNHYVDCSTQVDRDEEDCAATSGTTAATNQRKPFISLTKRLLRRCHQERAILDKRKEEETAKLAAAAAAGQQAPTFAAEQDSTRTPPLLSPKTSSPVTEHGSKDGDGDVVMAGGGGANEFAPSPKDTGSTRPDEKPRSPAQSAQPPADAVMTEAPSKPPPQPAIPPFQVPLKPVPPSAASSLVGSDSKPVNGVRPTGLRMEISSPPPSAAVVPPHTANASASALTTPAVAAKIITNANTLLSPTPQTPSAGTTANSHQLFPPPSLLPSSSAQPAPQQPQLGLSPSGNQNQNLVAGGGGQVQPSPAKKKLSLGDYMSRRSSNIHNNKSDQPPTPSASAMNSATPMSEKPLAPVSELAAVGTGEDAIVDTPMTEKADPLSGSGGDVVMAGTAEKA